MKPMVDRPLIPEGYGVRSDGPLLDWAVVESRLIEASHYWVATTSADGGPHAVPRWGVWLDGRFWYDGSPRTKHARNLQIDPRCTLHLEEGAAATIVEGLSVASSPISVALGERLSVEFTRKYRNLGYAPAPDAWSDGDAGGMRVLTPAKAMAWSEFPTDVTRFRFS